MSLYTIFSRLRRAAPEEKRPTEALVADLAKHDELADTVWQHKKGGVYRIVCIAFRETTMNLEVVYRDVHHPVTYIRPLEEFMDGRFKRFERDA